MQVFIQQHSYPVPTCLDTTTSQNKISRYLPDSLYLSIAIAAGFLWLALSGFSGS